MTTSAPVRSTSSNPEVEIAVLTDDELREVGRIAIRHALVNQLVQLTLWKLIDQNDDNIGANLTKRWSFSVLSEKLESLVPLRIQEGDFRDALSQWIVKAKWANRERNSIVHAALTRLHPDDERLTHFLFLPGEEETEVVVESFKSGALNYLADAFDQIAEEGIELFGRLEEGGEFKPIRATRRSATSEDLRGQVEDGDL